MLRARLAGMTTDPARWAVSPAVRQAMMRHGDVPVTDEVYHGSGTQYSETFGRSGKRYVWIRSTGAVYVYLPLDVGTPHSNSKQRRGVTRKCPGDASEVEQPEPFTSAARPGRTGRERSPREPQLSPGVQ
jgi:hypothetical protein